ncbi:hypothetical protein LPB72_03385 [Hydrogenophaga crassostreae]|uniref:Uncharacterized protein n=1 Tax=Hydrogenophaga crassostreae TaxID=1763535 RepID=A0A162PBU5_9BURK|nr:hypothetical protein [Hydrogenophaga crassostreae]AOW14387.1 hypothetical protein LPB072_17650 [Hydrogenophaga crassostreae]OAD43588.1 hypothetical protein LPB72_03385 [Hydrogenophaga crassostreae]
MNSNPLPAPDHGASSMPSKTHPSRQRKLMKKALPGLLLCLCGPAAWAQTNSSGSGDSAKAFVNFNNSPPRKYQRCTGSTKAFYESEPGAEKSRLSARACRKFLTHLGFVLNSLPAHARGAYRDTNFFLMLGETSTQGGHKSGMRFVTRGSRLAEKGYDPRWEDGIVVYSTTNLMYLSELWTRKAILHEMAHAWHLRNWPVKHPPLMSAWQKTRAAGLYLNVQDLAGKSIPKAYATVNQLEYFAELSAAYFVGINYQPFDRAGLAAYDPVGSAAVEAMWGLR